MGNLALYYAMQYTLCLRIHLAAILLARYNGMAAISDRGGVAVGILDSRTILKSWRKISGSIFIFLLRVLIHRMNLQPTLL